MLRVLGTTCALLVTAVILYTVRRRQQIQDLERIKLPGHCRVGITGSTNLRRYDKNDKSAIKSAYRVVSLFAYPVKSCAGIELDTTEIVETGLRFDRLFCFAQLVSKKDVSQDKALASGVAKEVNTAIKHEWNFITQRKHPRLALIKPELWISDNKEPVDGHLDPHRLEARAPKSNRSSMRKRRASSTAIDDVDAAMDRTATTAASKQPGGFLVLKFPFAPDINPFGLFTETVVINLPLNPSTSQYQHENMTIWRDHPSALNVTSDIEPEKLAKLKYLLGISNPLALFRVDSSKLRVVSAERGAPTAQQAGYQPVVGFADSFPLHIQNLASIRKIEEDIAITDEHTAEENKEIQRHNSAEVSAGGRNSQREKTRTKIDHLDARRFRANIYVNGPAPFSEDEWKRIRIASTEYAVACRTSRCKLPKTDPDTGIQDPCEPEKTLLKTRVVDKGATPHAVLGVQAVPLLKRQEGGVASLLLEAGKISVGDEVEVLEKGEHYYVKLLS